MRTPKKLVVSNIAVLAMFLVGVSYVLIYLVRYNPFSPPFDVSIRLASSGGLYSNSDVTYLGSPVGKIKSIDLTHGYVTVTVSIRAGVKIPRGTRAVVNDLSPVGEQYLDFEPKTASGPYLQSGDVIPIADTAVPTAFPAMLAHVQQLAQQINPKPIGSIVSELAQAFGDSRTDLRQVVNNSSLLLHTLTNVEPQTFQLLNDGRVVLNTAASLRPQLEQFSSSAQRLAQELASGAPIWDAALQTVPPSLSQIMDVLNDNTAALSQVMNDSAPLLSALDVRGAALTALLRDTPAAAVAVAGTIRNGWINGVVYPGVNFAQCAYGPTQIQQPWIAVRPPVNTHRTCNQYAPNIQQRGSYYAPRP